MTVQTLPGSYASTVLSLQRSQKTAEPMPCPPPYAWYLSEASSETFLFVRSILRIFPVYPPAIYLFPSFCDRIESELQTNDQPCAGGVGAKLPSSSVGIPNVFQYAESLRRLT